MNFTMYSQFKNTCVQLGMEGAADYAVKMGFSSVELLEFAKPENPDFCKDVKDAAKMKKILEERGLKMACYSVGADLYRQPEIEQRLMHHAEIVAALGCPYFHHTLLPRRRGEEHLELNHAVEVVADAAARVARYAASLGVTCIYEDQGWYVNGVDGFGVFWREIKNRCSNVGICGDIGNTYGVDESPDKFVKAYAKEIVHVHVKDYLYKTTTQQPGEHWSQTRGGNWTRHTLLGDGITDWKACLQPLKDAGYNGPYALELDHPEPHEMGIRQAMAYLPRVYEDLE